MPFGLSLSNYKVIIWRFFDPATSAGIIEPITLTQHLIFFSLYLILLVKSFGYRSDLKLIAISQKSC